MVNETLPFSSPAAQGVDAEGILRLLDALDADSGQDPHSLMIVRHGHVVAAGWWAPYERARPHLLYSLSKSFTSTAAAFAFAEGLIDLDAPVVSYFPEFDADITDPGSRAILVRHAASMSTGHTFDTLDQAVELDPAEPVRGFLLIPPERQPGTVFAYNQPATYSLAAIVQRVTGQTLEEYLRPRLLEPLGLPPFGWQEFPPGRNVGFTGLHAVTDAIARLGQLYLQGGIWEGRQLIPVEWVEEASRAHISTAPTAGVELTTPSEPDWILGYGYQFWMARHGYRGDGAFGQYCLILPEYDAVVAYTGATVDMQRTLDLVWDNLLPALVDEPREDGTDAESRLRDRLGALGVAEISVPAGEALRGDPVAPADWDGAVLSPDGPSAQVVPAPSAIEISHAAGGWRIALIDDVGRIESELGTGEWAASDGDSVPVAVEGGWLESGALRFDVIFLETPHRLAVTCSLPAGTFAAAWVTAPLVHGPMSLHELRSPSPR